MKRQSVDFAFSQDQEKRRGIPHGEHYTTQLARNKGLTDEMIRSAVEEVLNNLLDEVRLDMCTRRYWRKMLTGRPVRADNPFWKLSIEYLKNLHVRQKING